MKNVTPVQTISLSPLSVSTLNKVCSETLRCLDESQSMPLIELIYSRTGGNPFQFLQFFKLLHDHHKLITFDEASNEWKWDIEEIKKVLKSEEGIAVGADGYLSLIVSRLQSLNLKSQVILFLGRFVFFFLIIFSLFPSHFITHIFFLLLFFF